MMHQTFLMSKHIKTFVKYSHVFTLMASNISRSQTLLIYRWFAVLKSMVIFHGEVLVIARCGQLLATPGARAQRL